MFKKLVLLTVAVLTMLSLPAQAWRNDEITMLVMPREAIPVQIGQDIARRYPVLLVSYQMVRDDLKIFAWNGDSWVYVPVEDYTNGTFFAVPPKKAVIVESEKMRAPDVLTPGSLWCESAYRLTSTDPRVMLHLLGLSFDFPFRHWNQLANRYGYALEEINPTLENVYWWNLQSDVLVKKRARRDFSADLNCWQPLATIPAPVIESVITTEESATEQPAEPSATDVDIKVKAAEEPSAVTTPEETPAPAAAPEPVAVPEQPATPDPAPVVEEAPEASPIELSAEETVTTVEETVESAPAAETAVTAEETVESVPEVATETPELTEDPFAGDEVPAAEIVVPAEPKKPWWKLF